MPNHTVSTNVDTMLRAADNAAIRTAIGLGTTDGPTFLNSTVVGLTSIFRAGTGTGFSSEFGSGGLALHSASQIAWSSSFSGFGTKDLALERDAAGILAQRNGTAAQTLRVYNTYTDASNFEVGYFSWGSNVCSVGTHASGTGSFRKLALIGNGIDFSQANVGLRWSINTSGHFLAATDNTYDIGASGANRPRAGYFGTSISAAGTFINNNSYSFAGFRLFGNSAGNILLDSNGGSAFFMQFGGQGATAPAIKRNGTGIDIKLADDSTYAPLTAASLSLGVAVPTADLDIAKTWNAPAITVTGASGNGTTATITFATQAAAIQVGATIVVAGINPSGYNGTFVVTASSVTSVSYLNATSSAWVSGGTVQRQFTSIKLNVTDTASNAASNLMDLQVGGVSQFRVNKTGQGFFLGKNDFAPDITLGPNATVGLGQFVNSGFFIRIGGDTPIYINGQQKTVQIGSNHSLGFTVTPGGHTAGPDVTLFRDDVGILAQRNGVNAQAFRVYNSTDATPATNYDRAVFGFISNVLRIGAENGGTYTTARAIEFVTGGFANVNISSAGALSVGRNTSPGSISILNTVGSSNIQLSGNPSYGYHMAAPVLITWGSATQLNGSLDTGLARNAAGTVEVNTGTAGTYGFLKAKLQTSTAYTATVVTPTGFLTLYDSTGTAYRIPCVV
jgi:hypothetical protein